MESADDRVSRYLDISCTYLAKGIKVEDIISLHININNI